METVYSNLPIANPTARLLFEKMSEISQAHWCAGWISGNEYDLWEALHSEQHRYGLGALTRKELEELQVLSDLADGWIWTGRGKEFAPRLVTFAEWQAILSQTVTEERGSTATTD